MGKFARTVFLSLLFAGVLVFIIVATGQGAEVWTSIRPMFVPVATYFKFKLP